MRTGTYPAAFVVVGGAVAACVYLASGAPLLSAVAGVACGVSASAFAFALLRYPSRVSSGGDRGSRWTAVGVLVCTSAALLGVSPLLEVSNGVRFGIRVLVLGAGFGGYVTGVLAEVERGE